MVIFITGISSGFGLETAKLLAANGHKVYGTIRHDTELIPGIQYIKLDVRNSDEVNNAVKTIFDKEGRIDILINNAGMGIGGPIEFSTEEDVRNFSKGLLAMYYYENQNTHTNKTNDFSIEIENQAKKAPLTKEDKLKSAISKLNRI